MWLIKQCLDSWAAAGADLTLVELLGRAERIGAERFGAAGELLDVDDADLLLVGEMPRRINAQRARRGLPVLDESPANAPTFIALILHSLAARYAEVLARVRRHSGKPLERIFIVGGGSRNWLLNRLTAKATGLRVVCGPAESSTIGNLAVQLAVLEGGHGSSTREFAEDVAGWAGTLHPLDGAAVCP
jgi:rhamnulokinase